MIEQGSIITVYGLFEDNTIIDYDTGELVSCITYKIVKEKIQGKEGFFNLRPNQYNDLILFQYILT